MNSTVDSSLSVGKSQPTKFSSPLAKNCCQESDGMIGQSKSEDKSNDGTYVHALSTHIVLKQSLTLCI